MEINGVSNFRHRRSPSSDRFLGVFSPSIRSPLSESNFAGDELHESDVFWTGAYTAESSPRSTPPLSRRNLGFRLPDKSSGILAVLSDEVRSGSVLPSATPFRTIPKPPLQQSPQQQRFAEELTRSAPINVPAPEITKSRRVSLIDGFDVADEDEEEMLPPHEIVAMKMKTTSSVLEGVGRTLKGRDLRQVRNAVWRQTGFLD